MKNVQEACQHGEFKFLYPEPVQHIKIFSDFCPSDCILVYDKLGNNPFQKDCFRRKRVYAVRFVIKIIGTLNFCELVSVGCLFGKKFLHP